MKFGTSDHMASGYTTARLPQEGASTLPLHVNEQKPDSQRWNDVRFNAADRFIPDWKDNKSAPRRERVADRSAASLFPDNPRGQELYRKSMLGEAMTKAEQHELNMMLTIIIARVALNHALDPKETYTHGDLDSNAERDEWPIRRRFPNSTPRNQ